MGLEHQLSEPSRISPAQGLDSLQHPAVLPDHMFSAPAVFLIDLFAAAKEFLEAHLPEAGDFSAEELADFLRGTPTMGSQCRVFPIDKLVLDPGVGDHHRDLRTRQRDPVLVEGVAVKEENMIAKSEKG